MDLHLINMTLNQLHLLQKAQRVQAVRKTGYKGIGFKSVFTNSESVLIKSAGYNFSFDKNLPIYNDFKAFYYHVNDIENDVEKQKEFLHKYLKFFRNSKV